MANKQKAKDKTDLKDNSIDEEADIEEAESPEAVSYTHLTLPTT